MRTIALLAVLPLALAHPKGLWWGTDTCFNSPDNTDNECSDHQRNGFDWSDLADGAFSSYGGFDFSGFLSGNGFGSSGGRCISGKLSRSSAASLVISAGVDISAFSITNLRVSTSIETEIHIVYGMPDGSTCRDTAWCSSEAEDVSNDQCGGAISVGFELPENSDSEDCDLGIHQIDFDCSPGPKPPGGGHGDHPGPLPTPPSLPSPSLPGVPGPSSPAIPRAIPTPGIPSQGTTPPVGPIVTPPGPIATPPAPTIPIPTSIPIQIPPPSSGGSSAPPSGSQTTVVTYETVTTCPVTNTITSGASVTTEVSSTISTVTLTSTSTICTQCAHPPGVKPTSSAPGPAPPAQTTTVVTYETVTTCPVTTTITAGSTTSTSIYTTVSTLTLTSTNTIVAPTGAPSSPASPPPPPTADCPTVVPKCINTWLELPKCDSNADTACFCPSADFTNKVIACIQAWGSSAAEIQSALSYFAGICAAFVPTNPGIVTAVPTTITLSPPLPPKPTGVAPVPTGGAPAPPAAPCTTLTYSTYTVTVPQVGFSTSAGSSTTTVGLVPGPAPTGGSTATRIPNPWVPSSSTLATHRGGSSTGVSVPTETPILSNAGGRVGVSGVWAVGVAALVGFV